MTANWIHLSLVHFAVFGFPFCLFLGALGMWVESRVMEKTAHVAALVTCVVCGVSYFSGPLTYENLEGVLNIATVMEEQIEFHALWGRGFLMLSIVLGVILVVRFINEWQGEPVTKGLKFIVLGFLLSLTVVGFSTAHAGGKIRRPELMDVAQCFGQSGAISAGELSSFVSR